ncbi:ATP-binding protein [Streptomyces sp. NBC_01304]|uniref:ATP-binding protein n=1 Tax=Streptomyces sp. NBC_01304 TaxID=2903818 RepID=UPI002E0FCF25|nr:ATP-binding protein [Streptomyces sp. NBC_01304]
MEILRRDSDSGSDSDSESGRAGDRDRAGSSDRAGNRHGAGGHPPGANGSPVPAPRGVTALLELPFVAADLALLRHLVSRRSEDAGLSDPRLSDFVLAVHEVASNAIVHGGGKGRILLDRADGGLRCSIADQGPGFTAPTPPGSLPAADEAEHGRGLWLARALADRFEVVVDAAGTTVTLVAHLS